MCNAKTQGLKPVPSVLPMSRCGRCVSAPLQYSNTELEARVSHAKLDTEFKARVSTPLQLKTRIPNEKLDTEFEARVSTPPRHPNAELKTRVQRYFNG